MKRRHLFFALGVVWLGCAGPRIDVGSDEGPDAGNETEGGVDTGSPPDAATFATDSPSNPACRTSGWIVFDSDRDNFKRDIFVIKGDGSMLTRVTNHPGLEQEPAFAPDGVHLAYASDADGTSQIYVIDVRTHDVRKVTSRAEGADMPAWSPDGTLIAFHSGDDVYTIHADGTGETRLIVGGCPPPGLCSYQHPTFTPDGASVIADRWNQIETYKLDGSAHSFLIPNGAWNAIMPAVTSDGHTLAYVGECGVAVTPLTTPSYCDRVVGPGSHPSFGPTNALAFDQGNPADIMVSTSECSGIANLTNHPADDRNPSWAPPTFQGAPSVPPPR
jgi:Tol biopolymer transport system component